MSRCETRSGRSLDRVQVLVESASDFFPIELVYDFPTPSTDAGLCPGWKTRSPRGTCASQSRGEGPATLYPETVCPLGFWATLEGDRAEGRREPTAGADRRTRAGFEFEIRLGPTTERTRSSPRRGALCRQQPRRRREEGADRERAEDARPNRRAATYATTWEDWVEAVVAAVPTLLVLLSHTTKEHQKAALEIGEDETCLDAQLLPALRRSIGATTRRSSCCSAARPQSPTGCRRFVSSFQALGAALVVGTTASVLGQRAAPVARTIATELAAAAKRTEPIAAGDLITSITPQAAGERRADRALPHGLRRRRLAGRRRLARSRPVGGRLTAPHDQAGRQDEHDRRPIRLRRPPRTIPRRRAR